MSISQSHKTSTMPGPESGSTVDNNLLCFLPQPAQTCLAALVPALALPQAELLTTGLTASFCNVGSALGRERPPSITSWNKWGEGV